MTTPKFRIQMITDFDSVGKLDQSKAFNSVYLNIKQDDGFYDLDDAMKVISEYFNIEALPLDYDRDIDSAVFLVKLRDKRIYVIEQI